MDGEIMKDFMKKLHIYSKMLFVIDIQYHLIKFMQVVSLLV